MQQPALVMIVLEFTYWIWFGNYGFSDCVSKKSAIGYSFADGITFLNRWVSTRILFSENLQKTFVILLFEIF